MRQFSRLVLASNSFGVNLQSNNYTNNVKNNYVKLQYNDIPPFSKNVSANTRKLFLNLVNRTFPIYTNQIIYLTENSLKT